MMINLEGNNYNIEIEYKNNKNMYLRIKDDLTIYITCSKKVSNKEILSFIDDNESKVIKMINDKKKTKNNINKFLFLGQSYDICYINENKIIFGNNKVFINRNINIDNWYKKMSKQIFLERLNICYNNYTKKIPYPNLKVRKMKSKWGVCNITKQIITLNTELIKLDIKYIDYVIMHELSHLIYANHSKYFYSLLEENCPEYKQYRKDMKNIL